MTRSRNELRCKYRPRGKGDVCGAPVAGVVWFGGVDRSVSMCEEHIERSLAEYPKAERMET